MDETPIILYIGKVPLATTSSIRALAKREKKALKIGILYDAKRMPTPEKESADIFISCNISSGVSIARALKPHKEHIIAITCRGEGNINAFSKVIPHLPYLRTPTSESLLWATDKIAMREWISLHSPHLAPRHMVIHHGGKKVLDEIEGKVGFPVILKPANLAASLLVAICYHREELQTTLSRTLRKIRVAYKRDGRMEEPRILVEQFMEGEMYTIDSYVSSRGNVHHCPVVSVKTGKAIGFDDFFGYQQITPSSLGKDDIADAKKAVHDTIHALGLRNTTTHTELIKTSEGWKIIEIGPRIGGFRKFMYEHSYGINHALNDIAIRMGNKPSIPRTVKGYSVALKFFAKNEGYLSQLRGVQKIRSLASFKDIAINRKIGDQCLYAKHGGRSVVNLLMFNKEKANLLADIRRAEQTLIITTK
jgi:biotin carboxylase